VESLGSLSLTSAEAGVCPLSANVVVLSWWRKREDTKWNTALHEIQLNYICRLLYCVSGSLPIAGHWHKESTGTQGEIHASPTYQSRHSHRSWLRNMHPNLAEPGGEGGAQRWLTLRRWDCPSGSLQDNLGQRWKDIFPASPLSRTIICPTQQVPCCHKVCPGSFGGALKMSAGYMLENT